MISIKNFFKKSVELYKDPMWLLMYFINIIICICTSMFFIYLTQDILGHSISYLFVLLITLLSTFFMFFFPMYLAFIYAEKDKQKIKTKG